MTEKQKQGVKQAAKEFANGYCPEESTKYSV
jgi:hypothetical protein